MNERTQQPVEADRTKRALHGLRNYSYSSFFYGWPVWLVVYLMAPLTDSRDKPDQAVPIGQTHEWFHSNNNQGIFLLVLFLVIGITNFSVQGLASGMDVLGALLCADLVVWAARWDEVFSWFSYLRILLTLGAHFGFSTLMF